MLERIINAGAAGAVTGLTMFAIVLALRLVLWKPLKRLEAFKHSRADRKVNKTVSDFKRREAEFEESLKKG